MKEAEMAIPHLFRCPISLDLFTDPVTLCTGQTYDRSSIEKWLAAGNLTCPVTMQKLHDPSIVPNHTLRHLIRRWLRTGPHFDAGYLEMDPDYLALAALKHNLESHELPSETKLQALAQVEALMEELPSRSSCLAQLGFSRALLGLVFGANESKAESDEKLKLAERALSCAVKLMRFGEMGSLNVLSEEEHSLRSFLALFGHGSTMAKMGLCQIVEAASSSRETEELGALLGNCRELLQEMVLVVQENSKASDAGVGAMLAMCSSDPSREILVSEGAVGALVTYISNAQGRERSAAPSAVAAIELLLRLDAAKQALVGSSNGIKVLVKMVFRVSDHEGSESAIGSLMMVCRESARAREEAICSGVLTQLLLLLQSQCCGRTKSRARALLKLLRSLWGKEAKQSMGRMD